MELITDLKIQSKDKNRVNLYLNNKFFCGLDIETVVKNQLKVGIYIDQQKIVAMQTESEKHTAFSKALKLISTRYKTQKEIENYLYEKGYVSSVVYYVIQKLLEYGYIDDEKYVDSFVATHKNSFGKLNMKQLLLQKGVNSSLIEKKFTDEDFEQSDEIVRIAQKYMKSKEDTRENNIKLFRYLIGKGFSYDEIKEALKKEVE